MAAVTATQLAMCSAEVPSLDEPQSEISPDWLAEVQDTSAYSRIDETLFAQNPSFTENHVLHDALRTPRSVQDFQVYMHTNQEEVVAIVRLGEATSGHKGLVHGGLASTLLDETFGWLSGAVMRRKAFTANLSVNFKAPLPVGNTVVVHARLDRTEGRKIFMSANLGSVDKTVTYSNATSLFIIARE